MVYEKKYYFIIFHSTASFLAFHGILVLLSLVRSLLFCHKFFFVRCWGSTYPTLLPTIIIMVYVPTMQSYGGTQSKSLSVSVFGGLSEETVSFFSICWFLDHHNISFGGNAWI